MVPSVPLHYELLPKNNCFESGTKAESPGEETQIFGSVVKVRIKVWLNSGYGL